MHLLANEDEENLQGALREQQSPARILALKKENRESL
jgi:hypothetical protein